MICKIRVLTRKNADERLEISTESRLPLLGRCSTSLADLRRPLTLMEPLSVSWEGGASRSRSVRNPVLGREPEREKSLARPAG